LGDLEGLDEDVVFSAISDHSDDGCDDCEPTESVSVSQQTSNNTQECEASSPACDMEWCGFKLVFDDIDKNVKPRFQRNEIKSQSLHYVHAYAVKDRINMASLSDLPPALDPSTFLTSILVVQREISSR